MCNVQAIVFRFLDVSIFCVGPKRDVDLLALYHKTQEENLDAKLFIERIVNTKIYARLKAKDFASYIKYKKYNLLLKKHGLLFDLKYFDEAMFLTSPQKVLSVLGFDTDCEYEFYVSEYMRKRFPDLSEILAIGKAHPGIEPGSPA